MWIPGPATHVSAVDWPEPAFVLVTSPVFSTTPLPPGQTPPVAEVVGATMCTVNVDAPCERFAGTVTPLAPPHVRLPPAIAQLPPQPEPCEAIDQFRPAFFGSTSLSFTPFALPVPVL